MMSASAPAGSANSSIGTIAATCTSATSAVELGSATSSHCAPTVCIQVPSMLLSCANHSARNAPIRSGELDVMIRATDTRAGQHAFLDARHRAHARVEDRIRTGRDTGLGRLPSRSFKVNQAWLVAVMIAVDLLAFAQTLLLHDTGLARAEPKTLRYRLLHVAARLTRGQRRLWLRLDRHWPWATHLAAAFARLAALPTPSG